MDDVAVDPYAGQPWSWASVAFREIVGSPGYGVDSDGGAWSRRPVNGKGPLRREWRQLKVVRHSEGYSQVRIGKGKIRLVHHLVLEAFIGPCPEGMECCHRDGKRQNNRLNNLRWGTRRSNIDDIDLHGTRLRGEDNPGSKLRATQVAEIRQLYGPGMGYKRLARRFEVAEGTVYDIIKRRTWAEAS